MPVSTSSVEGLTKRLLTPRIRRKAFRTLDLLRGSPIGQYVDEVTAVVTQPDFPASITRREAHLQDLLTHAVASVPFYRELRPARRRGQHLLAHFPVVSKPDIVGDYDAFLSDSFDTASLPQVETSGSSGTPFGVPRDPLKRQRHIADLIAFGRMARYDFGDPVVFLSVSRGLNTRRSVRHRLQGVHYVAAQVFDAALVERWLEVTAGTAQPITLVGAPSALEFIGRALETSGRELPHGKVAAVIAISEAMTPWLQTHSEQVFGADAIARYSNEESGIIAQQNPGSFGRYVVNEASYVVEVLSMDSDEPVATGDIGRIVITDLFTRAMPLIRYDSGDLGRWSTEHPHELAEVVGRQMDIIYGDRGQLITPSAVLFKLFGFDGIRQFQFAQTGALTHRLNLLAVRDPDRDTKIKDALGELLGPEAVVSVEYVDEIESMRSGKRRPVANQWGGAPGIQRR